MAHVLHLRATLELRPELPELPGVAARTFAGDSDVDRWLELRHRAFAREKLGIRHWDRADFDAEFRAKSWWDPRHLWFAEFQAPADPAPLSVGTVTLAFRGGEVRPARPVVHWLAVLPAWRRRGVGQWLMILLHQTCWDLGYREVWLETHVQWAGAVRLYEALGYRPASE